MDPFTLLALAGLAVVALRKPTADQAPQQQPPPQQEEQDQGAGGGELQDLGKALNDLGATVTAAGGALLGDTLQKNFYDGYNAPTVDAGAPVIGGTIAGGSYMALGGLGGATAAVGGSVLVGIAAIAIPAVVVTAFVLSLASDIEDRIRRARWLALYEKIRELRRAGNYQAAWNEAVRAANEEQQHGLGFRTNARAAIPATFQDTKGKSWNTAEQFQAHYAISRAKGDELAAALEKAWPWLFPGTLVVAFSPEYKAAAAAQPIDSAVSEEAYKRMKEMVSQVKASHKISREGFDFGGGGGFLP